MLRKRIYDLLLMPPPPGGAGAGIGTPGQAGFGVGVAPQPLEGFTLLSASPTHEAYGNYQHDATGSVMCWIPRFWYRIGHADNPTYAQYGANSVSILPASAYATREAAAADGYALHRAFVDGDEVRAGFLVDKYMISAEGGVAVSKALGLPMSSHADHNPFSQVGANNAYYGAIDACKTRGGGFFPKTRFITSALALLSLAHGQAATSDEYCAWYDPAGVTNFPKGCNNNALGDTNDSEIAYESDGFQNCGKTGSANLPARVSHNGQLCGVMDLNGLMYEVDLGLTRDRANTSFWVLKESVHAKSLTSGDTAGAGGGFDAWGDNVHLATLYDEIALPQITAEGTAEWHRFGNSDEQVLSPATEGDGWLYTSLGFYQSTDAKSSNGTNLFGQDSIYERRIARLCVLSGLTWTHGSRAGLWAASLNRPRTHSNTTVGARAACYPV